MEMPMPIRERGEDEDVFAWIQSHLANDWQCHLISTLTPGTVRLQLANPGDYEPGWRKCVEGPTLDAALSKAIVFSQSITWQDYDALYRQTASA